MNKIFKVGLIGCGHISETYFRGHDYFNNFQIIKCADINIENAKKCAETYGIESCSVDELLNDSEIEIILNLTIPRAHYEIAKKSLDHGKHVYSEKPMAVNFVEGEELLNLANSKNLYIGNAPDTFLGGGIQKSIDLINQGKIGNVRLGSAIFAYPGVQSYHPNPEPWFANNEGGPVMDMGPYYLTALVNLLGPAKRVHGISTKVFEKRVIGIGPKKDQEFTVDNEQITNCCAKSLYGGASCFVRSTTRRCWKMTNIRRSGRLLTGFTTMASTCVRSQPRNTRTVRAVVKSKATWISN